MFLILNLKKRLMLLLCITVVGFFITSLISGVVLMKFPDSSAPLRIVTIMQDVFLFITPAIVTAMLVTRQPATLLAVDRPIPWIQCVLGLLVIVAMAPAMNVVVWLNKNIPLPADVYDTLCYLEDQAATTVELIMGQPTLPNFIMAFLVVAVAAGFSEELFFRGGLQRLLTTGGVNVHVAIWVTAMCFSLLHMQFFGFVPRMLLGALFGYALVWTRTLWVPMLMHIFNNTLYIINRWVCADSDAASNLDTVGVTGDKGYDIAAVCVSVAIVVLALYFMRRLRTKPEK